MVPVVPQHPGDFEELRTDLTTIGCEELLYRVWDLQDARMLAELVGGDMEPAFRSSFIRAKYKHWTREHWRMTYGFPDTTNDLEPANKGDSSWVKERFSHISDKDGFKVEDCKTPREQRLLQFLVPIFSPDKPTTITITLAKGIYSALYYKKKINWGFVVQRNVNREASKIGGTKGCPIAPFLYHLYAKHGCLTDREKARLETQPVPVERSPAKKKAARPGGERNRARRVQEEEEEEEDAGGQGDRSESEEREMAHPEEREGADRTDREDRVDQGESSRARTRGQLQKGKRKKIHPERGGGRGRRRRHPGESALPGRR